MRKKEIGCPAEATLKVIGGRWKLLILRELDVGVVRFAQLRRTLTGISEKVLTQQLRELERNGVVQRKTYAEVPPRVEYSLTSSGRALQPIVEAMHQWGARHPKDKGTTRTFNEPSKQS